MKLQPIALANTFGLIDLILHPLFHLWVGISPESYERMMQLFVAGLRLEVDQAVELSAGNLVLSTVLEASVFWLLGFMGAIVYNRFSKVK